MTTATAIQLKPLAPLARTIAETVRDTPVRLGTPEGAADLVATLTVRVAAYVGSELPTTPGVAQHMVEVDNERQAQLAKWGEQHHPDGTGPRVPAVVGALCYADEAAHRARLACQSAANNGKTTWRLIFAEEVLEALAEEDPAALRTELIQCAAVIQAWLWDLDTRPAAAQSRPGT